MPSRNDGTVLPSYKGGGGGEEEPFSCWSKFFHLCEDDFYFSPNK